MNTRTKSLLRVSTAFALLAAAACAGAPLKDDIANRLASPVWMVERQIPAGPFNLTVYERMHTRYAPADIYIEGDGQAWLSNTRLSLDPTPANPVALHLATRDKSDNLVWMARPCQYSGLIEKETPCDATYWTDKRFAPEVLAAYNAALDEIKQRWNIESFNLIGFSGGGAIASILAAQRSDVASLRTVAGNLDHQTHSAYHNVSTLDGSLNPPEFAAKLASVPQVHFIGGQDEVVPPAVLHSYLQAVGDSSCVQYKFIQEAQHEQGWVDKWPELLAIAPVCTGPAMEINVMQDLGLPEPEFDMGKTQNKP